MDEVAACDDAAGEVPTAAYPAMLALLMGGADRAAGPGCASAAGHPGPAGGAAGRGRPRGHGRSQRGQLAAAGRSRGHGSTGRCAGIWACRRPSRRSASPRTTSWPSPARRKLVLSRAAKDENWCTHRAVALDRRGCRRCSRRRPAGAPRHRTRRRRLGETARPADAATPGQSPRPRPCPPAAARPRELWATDIERLIRDPYSIYARRILKLAALDPIDADAGGAERGQIIHAVLQEFVSQWPDQLPADPRTELLRAGRQAFRRLASRPQVWAVWWPRFERIADLVRASRAASTGRAGAGRQRGQGQLLLDAPGGPFTAPRPRRSDRGRP